MIESETAVSAADPGVTPLRTSRRLGDAAFRWIALAFALAPVVLIVLIGQRLYSHSAMTRHAFGWRFLTTSTWDPVHGDYGALPFMFGTFVTSILALVLAVPFGVGCAVFLAEYAPARLSAVLSFLIELLAAIPSVIYGLWGFLVLCPWMQATVNPWLADRFGAIPLFGGPPVMTNVLAAGIVLTVMVLPFITAVSRDVLKLVPEQVRLASLGLGATKWETVRSVVLPAARSGIAGAVMLALGRAIGETMAVVMVVGNDPAIHASLLQPGYSMPALLANQFNESYTDPLQLSALLEIALVLFVITLIVNAMARLLIVYMGRQHGSSSPTRWTFGSRAGAAVLWAVRAAIALVVARQVFHDVAVHGARGLFGALECLVLAYAAVRAATAWSHRAGWWRIWRKINNAAMGLLLALCTILACVVLGLLFYYVGSQGMKEFKLTLFTQLPYPPGEPGGGVKNAIVGTLVLVAVASAIGIPIGVAGGIFLSEFGQSRFGGVIRFCADVLSGIPSVVIGMFAYAMFVLPFGHFSAAAGGAALGIMMIPTIGRTTEEMLRLVPTGFRDASLGLGGTRVRTVFSVVLPAARAGVVTGIMVAVARVAGETAPLLFTAFGSDVLSTRLNEPISAMTLRIYQYAVSPYQDWIDKAWSSALVLVLFVLVVSLIARLATRSRYNLKNA